MPPKLPIPTLSTTRRAILPIPRQPTLKNPPQPPLNPLLPLQQPTTPPPSRRFSSTPQPQFLSSFSSLPQPPPKTLSAQKTLPYPPSKIYSLISDINSYSLFLPHCTHSLITQTTPPPFHLPSLADLTVGYGPLTQSYTSHVYCIPSPEKYIVEAISGNADSSIPLSILSKHGYDINSAEGRKKTDGGIFERLVTRWEVLPVGQEEQKSDVRLRVTFQFANPVLGFAAGGVADMKIDEMVEAFERRARVLFGGNKGDKGRL
ncbi:coenzyme Q-binding protein COQ10, mitochondrial [Podospora fimiseda]|uniref:Coenzyme Q-binding protein COQ10, mitochondrial n=1 Tax=Podospora fimiseda TaxID=252190 RepID=A0AAN7H5G4_9PEZI|nr:coenzyme Q-binding protein COQ10, mitochondrial [Podospora fimiseda]